MPHDSIELNLRTRMPYFNLINKKHERFKIKKKLKQFNNYLKSYGLCFNNIVISEDNKSNDFNLIIQKDKYENDLEINAICQNARDQACMSDKAYKSFRKTIKPVARIVSLARCVKYKKLVDQFWNLEINDNGSYIADPLSKIKFICKKYLERIKESDSDFHLNILLSGDSFNLTKTHTNLLNFTFSLLNNGDLSHTGFYILGIFNIEKENYENIESSLKELIQKLKDIKSLTINEKTYDVIFHLGGDLKWLATVVGIGASNSNFPCPWCTWQSKTKEELGPENDINKDWSIERNHQTGAELLKEKTVYNRKGYLRKPLFSFIQFDKIVVDPLHLILRISDKLFEMLLFQLHEFDKNEPSYKVGDQATRIYTIMFLDYLKDEKNGCNLTAPYYIFEKEFKLRSLNENERIKIFENICCNDNLFKIFPNKLRKDKLLNILYEVFKDFYEIIKLIKKDYNKEEFNKNQLNLKIKAWLKNFVKVEKDITPYIHILGNHVVYFVENYKNLNLFSMQGLEKLNHVTKQNYFKQTNRQKDFIVSLIKKMNRMEFINVKGDINDLNKIDV